MPSSCRLFVVEIGLVDGGAGEAVLDVNIDVKLAQAELRFLAVRIEGDQFAPALAIGNQRRIGGDHDIAHPIEQRRRPRCRRRFRGTRQELLARVHHGFQSVHLHFPLRHRDGAVGRDGEFRSQRDGFGSRCRHDKAISVLRSDFHINLAAVEFQSPIRVESNGGVFIQKDNGAIGQRQAPTVGGRGTYRRSDRQQVGSRCRFLRLRNQTTGRIVINNRRAGLFRGRDGCGLKRRNRGLLGVNEQPQDGDAGSQCERPTQTETQTGQMRLPKLALARSRAITFRRSCKSATNAGSGFSG